MDALIAYLSAAALLLVAAGCALLLLAAVEWVIDQQTGARPSPGRPAPVPSSFEQWLLGKRSASGGTQTPVGKWPSERGASGQPLSLSSQRLQSPLGLSTCPRVEATCPRAKLARSGANPSPEVAP